MEVCELLDNLPESADLDDTQTYEVVVRDWSNAERIVRSVEYDHVKKKLVLNVD